MSERKTNRWWRQQAHVTYWHVSYKHSTTTTTLRRSITISAQNIALTLNTAAACCCCCQAAAVEERVETQTGVSDVRGECVRCVLLISVSNSSSSSQEQGVKRVAEGEEPRPRRHTHRVGMRPV